MPFFRTLLLIFSGAILFALSHPGVLLADGNALCGYVALVPVFLAVRSCPPWAAGLWGFVYGALSYALCCHWLSAFHPCALFLVTAVCGVELAIVFWLCAGACRLFVRGRFCMLALLWCAYEYVRTLGFLGFPYGGLGYSQWRFLPVLQAASAGGVWLPCALCASCAAVVAHACDVLCSPACRALPFRRALALSVRTVRAGALAWLCCFAVAVVSGAVALRLPAGECVRVPVLCVQNNTDSNKYGVDVYRRDMAALLRLTEAGLRSQPGTQFVVWPETAVVPPVEYHYAARSDGERLALVESLLSAMERADACFVIGNQRSVAGGGPHPDDYNATLVFDSREGNVIPPRPHAYAKQHLVPFTEYFPYGRLFPRLYALLLDGDTHLWTPGTEPVVFSARGIRFSTPICFEDSFGALCRRFVQGGAQCFFMVSNDSWAQSRACQVQHLAMAVFRCAESRVPAARSTASGVTCLVDGAGRVREQVPAFVQAALPGELCVPPVPGRTPYVRWGDWLPRAELVLFALCVAVRLAQKSRRLPKKTRLPIAREGQNALQ